MKNYIINSNFIKNILAAIGKNNTTEQESSSKILHDFFLLFLVSFCIHVLLLWNLLEMFFILFFI